MSPLHRPVRRRRVLVGAAVVALGIAGIVWLAEALRHPAPSGGPTTLEAAGDPAADPRAEAECAATQAREGPSTDPATVQPPTTDPVEVSSNELYACPNDWDGRGIRYEGEAIAGVLPRDGGAWVQLNDDVYADASGPLPAHRDYRGGNAGVGVFVPEWLADEIGAVGGPLQRGDLVEVTGVFHRVDSDSGEVAVIRADRGHVVRAGEPFVDVRLRDREIAAVLLGVLALGLVTLERTRAWARRRGR